MNRKVEAYASQHDAVSRLVTILGIGALGATAIVEAAGDGRQFKKARDMAAWLGLVPAEHSTGGKQTLLGISRRGNRYVRRLIIHGARSCFLHLNRANHALGGWLTALEARTHRNKAIVALANKLTLFVAPHLTIPFQVLRFSAIQMMPLQPAWPRSSLGPALLASISGRSARLCRS
uniref:transposase n=1 Tax=Paracoccus zhejiangensis TaxID=1077935 RepID=UPI0026B495BD